MHQLTPDHLRNGFIYSYLQPHQIAAGGNFGRVIAQSSIEGARICVLSGGSLSGGWDSRTIEFPRNGARGTHP